MKKFLSITALSILWLIGSACATNKYYKEFAFASVQNNVCKSLDDKVVIYAIFVDSKFTGVWNEYDIASTKDSIRKAINWIEQKAKEDSVDLDISLEVHQGINGKYPIKKDLTKKTLSATIFGQPYPAAERDLHEWADKIASVAGKSLQTDNSKMTMTRNTMRDSERLIARLRDIHKTDNIALIYFVNNYYKDEVSMALNTDSDRHVEFSIVSFKKPSVIAHEFLHLFGAMDMYVSPFDKKRGVKKFRQQFNNLYPNEVMTNTQRNIDSLIISDFTKYLIGWNKKLPDNYQSAYRRKGYKAAEY